MALSLTWDARPPTPQADAREAVKALDYLVRDLGRHLTDGGEFDQDWTTDLLGDVALTAAAYQQSLISAGGAR